MLTIAEERRGGEGMGWKGLGGKRRRGKERLGKIGEGEIVESFPHLSKEFIELVRCYKLIFYGLQTTDPSFLVLHHLQFSVCRHQVRHNVPSHFQEGHEAALPGSLPSL